MDKTIVIHHRADYDGLFCREIARKFRPDAEVIGWDYGDPVPQVDLTDTIIMLDINIDELMSHPGLIWIDHHKSAMEKYADAIAGVRMDGVAACRLTWQYFTNTHMLNSTSLTSVRFPTKDNFVSRQVEEPQAVRLAGEYDVWDHRGDGDLELQFGLDTQRVPDWDALLSMNDSYTKDLIEAGWSVMQCYAKRDADAMRERAFLLKWEGLTFLALNTAKCNSNTFSSRDKPETGHDALLAFCFNGHVWKVTMYHAAHRKDIDLSLIAVGHGGGGHRGACGFESEDALFLGTKPGTMVL